MLAGVNLLLVDDHPLFRDGFAQMAKSLRPHWQLCFANSMQEGLSAITLMPDIDLCVIDLMLPDGDGFAVLADVARRTPDLPCLLISGREDAAARLRAQAAGASGFISKGEPPETIVETIDRVLAGDLVFGIEQNAIPSFTPRQIDVLLLLAQGLGNKEIRYRLGIAERTVRAHLTETFALLGVSGRVQAILRARALGLIE